MNTDSFIICIKTNDIYKDIAENVETRFDTFEYYKYCLEATHLKKPSRKNEIDVDNLKKRIIENS